MREELEKMRALSEAASPGPWERSGYTVHESDPFYGPVVAECGMSVRDAKFISASRTIVPKLLAALEAVYTETHKSDFEPHLAGRIRSAISSALEAK
jgi:hypothetical protein